MLVFQVVVALAIATVVAKPEADPVYYNGVYAPSVYAAPSVYGEKNTGWEFTKLLTQIFNIFRNFGPSNLEITMSLSSF